MVKAKTTAEKIVKAKKVEKKLEGKKRCCCSFLCSNVFKRITSAVILIPLVLFILSLGFPFTNLLILLIGSMFAYEWANMVKNNNPSFYATLYTVALAVGVLFPVPLIVIATVLVCGVVVCLKAKGEEHRKFLTLGVLYVGICMSSILWFAQMVGFFATIWLLVTIWATDIGAYVVGCRLRGPKLAPKISPNKTWSGFFGGLLFAVCVSASFAWGAGLIEFYGQYIILALFVSIVGQIGDLLESAVKRKLGIKDSSDIIPGHGGIFDRLDSLLFVTPVLLLVLAISFMFI